LPLLDKGELKRLCFVSSEAGCVGASPRTGWFGYCMSKAALNIAVKNLSNDLSPQGFGFRLYHPGWMRTYMHGVKNLDAELEPEQAAQIALDYFLDPVNPKELTLHDWAGNDLPW
jgi:NAD(P)-dependent dehydrogenase (short-subunit alcohol dehydrogenase family)